MDSKCLSHAGRETRIIIGALSGLQYSSRRQQCRKTWMADAGRLSSVEAVFLIGAGEQVIEPTLIDDLLLLPCPNDYSSLPQRTRRFCRWALLRDDWDYLFKCDDDTYVAIDRLAAFEPSERDYIGAEWKPGVRYASGGAGYFLSRRAAAIVAETMTHETGAEDRIVGRLLRTAGVPFDIDERFVPFGDSDRRPQRDNTLITTHAVSDDVFLRSHQETGER